MKSLKYEVKKKLSDISRFILPNHKLCCHRNYCIDNVIIIVNLQLVQHSAGFLSGFSSRGGKRDDCRIKRGHVLLLHFSGFLS